jgi:hypothetical protein
MFGFCERKQFRVPFLPDECHRPFMDAKLHEILILSAHDDVDQRVADAVYSGCILVFHIRNDSLFCGVGQQ